MAKYTKLQVDEWKAFYAECQSMEKVCAKFGIPKPTLHWHLKRAGVMGPVGSKKKFPGETDQDVTRRRNLFQNYGLTPQQYDEMLAAQNGVCAICGRPPLGGKTASSRLNVDHDHKTGKNRGLLCNKCNPALGQFQDSVELLEKAISYLRGHQ